MEEEYIWDIKVKNTPLLIKKCSHCDSDRFYCSEKFRMNSQKRNIDVWLIYRCAKCDNTYNITILSRTKPELINKDLYNQFSENNTGTAWKYAFSPEIRRKNNMNIDFGSVEYDIQHDGISVEDIVNLDGEIITFRIKCDFEFNARLSSIIRTCLKLSANQLDKLIEAGVISIPHSHSLKKHRVKDGDIVQVNKEKLKSGINRGMG
ncbi:DUF1062 domain-containing protein [Bacteroides sp. 51]|uniref:DUF1062 domain-containing protein n=1 Tax=Bacteroides sp. 51 TaxID=2302938 RepID=UPI0013D22413|nr:DUF1062 domain-containing protein [Bacteroides sp. 51]NDV81426.1 DUF1062 domain-containing protein [Bacteroides sp. 51]